VLHPHFSRAGDKLFWSERISAQGGTIGTWALKIADFSTDGGPHLSNVETFQPGRQHLFYESSSFSPDGSHVYFSGNLEPGQPDTVMDIYSMDIASRETVNLTNSPSESDEHAQISPLGDRIVWMTSKGAGGSADATHPRSDYWMMRPDGSEKTQVTFFNDPGHAEFIDGGAAAADSSWSPDGTKLVAYVLLNQLTGAGRIVRIEFSGAVSTPGAPDASRPEEPPNARTNPNPGDRELAVPRSVDAPAAVLVAATAHDQPDGLAAWHAEIDRRVADHQLELVAAITDPVDASRTHERFAQVENGVRVIGGEITRQRRDRQPISIVGTIYGGVRVDPSPTIGPDSAEQIVQTRASRPLMFPDAPQLVIAPRPDGTFALAYAIRSVSSDDLRLSVVDARTGAVLESDSTIQPHAFAVDRLPHAPTPAITGQATAAGVYDLRGLAPTSLRFLGEAGPRDWIGAYTARAVDDRPTAAVAEAIGASTAYLTERLGTDPFARMHTPIAIVHPDDASGSGGRPILFTRGPFYAGKGVMVFPDPGGPGTGPPSLTTVAHQIGHAFVSMTSGLVSRGDRAAVDEAIAELIGRGVAGAFPAQSPALRRALPVQAGGRAEIVTRAFQAAVDGAAAEGVAAQAPLERAFYRAAAFMLPSGSTLHMMRVATLQAARDLGVDPTIERHLAEGWSRAGVE